MSSRRGKLVAYLVGLVLVSLLALAILTFGDEATMLAGFLFACPRLD